MNRTQWLQNVKLLAALWPNQPLPAETIDEWERALSQVPGEMVDGGIRKLVKTSPMRPGVADILGAARSIIRDQFMRENAMPALPPAQDVRKMMAGSRHPYVALLGRLIRAHRAGLVPTEDFQRLTGPSDHRFWQGHATEATVLELRNYLEEIEGAPEPQLDLVEAQP